MQKAREKTIFFEKKALSRLQAADSNASE